MRLLTETNTRAETRCPACGFLDATIICRYCKADKTEPLQPAPAEACTDLGVDDEPDSRWDEDEYLDDPRHGQAAVLNRENRGRHD